MPNEMLTTTFDFLDLKLFNNNNNNFSDDHHSYSIIITSLLTLLTNSPIHNMKLKRCDAINWRSNKWSDAMSPLNAIPVVDEWKCTEYETITKKGPKHNSNAFSLSMFLLFIFSLLEPRVDSQLCEQIEIVSIHKKANHFHSFIITSHGS